MRARRNCIFIAIAVPLLILVFLVIRHIIDLGDQYSVGRYAYASWNKASFYNAQDPSSPSGVEVKDKIIVMATTAGEDPSWTSLLPSCVTPFFSFCQINQTDIIKLAKRNIHRR